MADSMNGGAVTVYTCVDSNGVDNTKSDATVGLTPANVEDGYLGPF